MRWLEHRYGLMSSDEGAACGLVQARGKNLTIPGPAGTPSSASVAVQERSTITTLPLPRRRERERSRVNLADLDEPEVTPTPAASITAVGPPAPRFTWRSLNACLGWLCLAERVVGDWASTVRKAGVMAAVLLGVAVDLGILFGVGSVALAMMIILVAVTARAIARRCAPRSKASTTQRYPSRQPQLRVVPGLAGRDADMPCDAESRSGLVSRVAGHTGTVRELARVGHTIHHHGRWCAVTFPRATATRGERATGQWEAQHVPKVRIPS